MLHLLDSAAGTNWESHHLGDDIKEMRHPAASLTGKEPLLGHRVAARLLNGRDARSPSKLAFGSGDMFPQCGFPS